jgi:SAM-dependent methyltransferase
MSTQKPQRAVPSDIYTEDYFLSPACEGFEAFADGRLSPIKQKELDLLDAHPGQRVLDLGCGRGEVVAALRGQGIDAVAVDYAAAAVRLAATRLAGEAVVVRADGTALPFRSGSFDRVLMGDVIEHLPWNLGVAALREVGRVLAPGGRALIHTSPNRWFVTYLLPVTKVALRWLGKSELVARFDDYESRRGDMHPNELSPVGLQRLVRDAGLTARTWVDPDVLRSGASDWTRDLSTSRATTLISRLAGSYPLRTVIGNDLYALIEAVPSR